MWMCTFITFYKWRNSLFSRICLAIREISHFPLFSQLYLESGLEKKHTSLETWFCESSRQMITSCSMQCSLNRVHSLKWVVVSNESSNTILNYFAVLIIVYSELLPSNLKKPFFSEQTLVWCDGPMGLILFKWDHDFSLVTSMTGESEIQAIWICTNCISFPAQLFTFPFLTSFKWWRLSSDTRKN